MTPHSRDNRGAMSSRSVVARIGACGRSAASRRAVPPPRVTATIAWAPARSASITAASQSADAWSRSPVVRGTSMPAKPRALAPTLSSASRMIASSVCTVRAGKAPTAVSPESMIASTPSSTRVGRVAHFGAGWPGLGCHRLEHLRRQDHRHAAPPRARGDFLLRPRHALERHLEAEIAARHHHRLAGLENLVQALHRPRPLELRHERDVRDAGLHRDFPRPLQVVGRLHEAHGDEIDAERQAEAQVIGILRGNRRRRQVDAGRGDALVLAEHPAVDDERRDVSAIDPFHAQLDHPVGEQQAIPETHARRQAIECRVDAAGPAEARAGCNRQPFALSQLDRLTALHASSANLGTAEILENGHDTISTLGGRADPPVRPLMRLVRPVREVQPDAVDARRDHRVEHGVVVALWTDGGEDLRMTHGCIG